MTSAILVVRAGEARYGLPLEDVERLVAASAPLPAPGVRAMRGVVAVGDGLVPLVNLPAVLGGGAPRDTVAEAAVVIRLGTRRVALEVDEALGVIAAAFEPVPAGWNLPWAVGVSHDGPRLVPIVDLGVVAERLGAGDPEDGR